MRAERAQREASEGLKTELFKAGQREHALIEALKQIAGDETVHTSGYDEDYRAIARAALAKRRGTSTKSMQRTRAIGDRKT